MSLPSRRTFLITAGAILLLSGGFAAGAWVGAHHAGSSHGYQVLPRASANADALHRKLLLLDEADHDGVRRELDMELDGELIAMCTLAKERTRSSDEAITAARAILQRIARYRHETPPVYPTAYTAQVDERSTKIIQACLQEALGTFGK